MVKKRVVKKAGHSSKRKKIVKPRKVSKKADKGLLRKDFEIFAKGIQRLEELRIELDSLNASGYEAEANAIRSKLKNVAYIPQIEKEMDILKQKINGTYKEKEKEKEKKTKPSADEHAGIKRKIRELEEEIKKRKKINFKKPLSDEELKLVQDIPHIESQLNSFKKGLEEQRGISEGIIPEESKIRRKIKELEDEIEKRKAISVKKQLSKDEVKFVKEIPKIENQLKSLKKSVDKGEEDKKRKEEMLKRIDPDVDLLVNNKFNLTLDEIKAELSKKLQGKELAIQRQLQEDLEARRKNFEIQYRDLEKKFSQKYEDNVKNSLQDEVKTKLNEILKKRISEMSKRLGDESNKRLSQEEMKLKQEERKKISELKQGERKKLGELIKKEKEKERKVELTGKQLDELKKKVEEELEEKRANLQKEYAKNLAEAKSKLNQHFNEEVLIHKSNLNSKMHEHLTGEVKKIHKEYEDKKKLEEGKFESRKRAEEGKFESRKRAEEGKLSRTWEEIQKEKGDISGMKEKLSSEILGVKKDEIEYKRKLADKLEEEKKQAIEKAVKEQAGLIRERLKKEFDERLKLEIKSKEAEFDKKKIELTLEIQKKARQLFS